MRAAKDGASPDRQHGVGRVEGSAVARSSGYRPRDRRRFMDSTPDLMRTMPRPRSPPHPGAGSCWWVPARRSPLDSQPGQKAVERAADRWVCRCRSCSLLQPAASQPSFGPPSPDRSHPGAGAHRSPRRAGRPARATHVVVAVSGKSGPHVREPGSPNLSIPTSPCIGSWSIPAGSTSVTARLPHRRPPPGSCTRPRPPFAPAVADDALASAQLATRWPSGASISGRRIALLVLSPLFAMVAVAILVTTGRPIFYSQERVGQGGRLVPHHQVSQYAERRRERNRPDLGLGSRQPLHQDR